MSKYTDQDKIEEDGRKLLASSLDSNFFLLNDFSAAAGKDKNPDIDGHIRLRNGNGNYLNLFLHYQLKSTRNLQAEKFHLVEGITQYLLSTNVPTLLFVADVTNRKVYWFFLDEPQKKKLGLNDQKISSVTIDLCKSLVNPSDAARLNQLWQTFAREDDYGKLNDSISSLAKQVHQNIQKCLGLIFLLKRVPKNNLANLFHQVLQIERVEIEFVVEKLVDASIISETVNFYLLDNEQLGTESLIKLLTEVDLTALVELFQDKNDRKRILKQLATIENDVVQNYLARFSSELLEFVKEPTNNDTVFTNLEILEGFAYRVSAKALEIIKTIVNTKPIPATMTNYVGIGQLEGKSHQDLIRKCIEILDRIRYQERDVFDVLVELAKKEQKTISVLDNLCKYDIHALKKSGL